jgi:hypothetical protein
MAALETGFVTLVFIAMLLKDEAIIRAKWHLFGRSESNFFWNNCRISRKSHGRPQRGLKRSTVLYCILHIVFVILILRGGLLT